MAWGGVGRARRREKGEEFRGARASCERELSERAALGQGRIFGAVLHKSLSCVTSVAPQPG